MKCFRFSGLLTISGGDADLLNAARHRPEESHSVNQGTRSAVEEQLMAYLTVARPVSLSCATKFLFPFAGQQRSFVVVSHVAAHVEHAGRVAASAHHAASLEI